MGQVLLSRGEVREAMAAVVRRMDTRLSKEDFESRLRERRVEWLNKVGRSRTLVP